MFLFSPQNHRDFIIKKIRAYNEIIGITIVGFILRLYMAKLDPMLHDWDEKYHALVAKNMMQHPFKPMLYTHQYFSTDPFNWTYNHIWLHKQPLFLWQMALSMKIFGVSEFTLRLPSVVMGTLMIILVYRVCILATGQKMAALFAAILLCFNHYYLNLISGREGMDHNDIAFGFYVLASFWAFAEYVNKGSWKWILLTGFFAGCAILNKWLTGLIVFAPWGILTLIDLVKSKKFGSILPLLAALLICCLVFLPWQCYILYTYPELAKYEYAFNAKHIWEVVEGHGGDIWRYLNLFPHYFGWYLNFLVPFGFIILFFQKDITLKYKLLLSIAPVIVFCFFSFVVQTKIKAYFFMMAPICIILMGLALNKITNYFGRLKYLMTFILIITCVYFSLNFKKINDYTNEVYYRQSKIYNTNIYKNLDAIIPANIKLVVNTNFTEHIDIMFYSKRLEAYHSAISEEEFKSVTKNNIPIAAFESREGHVLPDYIENYKNLHIIKVKLR